MSNRLSTHRWQGQREQTKACGGTSSISKPPTGNLTWVVPSSCGRRIVGLFSRFLIRACPKDSIEGQPLERVERVRKPSPLYQSLCTCVYVKPTRGISGLRQPRASRKIDTLAAHVHSLVPPAQTGSSVRSNQAWWNVQWRDSLHRPKAVRLLYYSGRLAIYKPSDLSLTSIRTCPCRRG